MKLILTFTAAACFSGIAFASDCSSMKMRPTDALAPAATKVADNSKRLPEVAKATPQTPKQDHFPIGTGDGRTR
ncbi:MAG: hypothetical protein EBX69_04030 [Betaproteobacteria bacterium]|nr:hypothetical protein [Betaproteobacteria bacterium]